MRSLNSKIGHRNKLPKEGGGPFLSAAPGRGLPHPSHRPLLDSLPHTHTFLLCPSKAQLPRGFQRMLRGGRKMCLCEERMGIEAIILGLSLLSLHNQ